MSQPSSPVALFTIEQPQTEIFPKFPQDVKEHAEERSITSPTTFKVEEVDARSNSDQDSESDLSDNSSLEPAESESRILLKQLINDEVSWRLGIHTTRLEELCTKMPIISQRIGACEKRQEQLEEALEKERYIVSVLGSVIALGIGLLFVWK